MNIYGLVSNLFEYYFQVDPLFVSKTTDQFYTESSVGECSVLFLVFQERFINN